MRIDFSTKKILVFFILCILILIAVIIGLSLLNTKTSESNPTELVSNDGSFKLIVPGKVKVERNTSDILDFYSSDDEMIVTSNVIAKEKEVVLFDIVNSEIADLPKIKNGLENVSDLTKVELRGYEAYKYSYTYFDSEYNNSFYTEVVWIVTDKNIYALDLEVITKNEEKYKPIFSEIINSFEEINTEVNK